MRVPDANTGATWYAGLLPFVFVVKRDGLTSGNAFGKVAGFADAFDCPIVRLLPRRRDNRLGALPKPEGLFQPKRKRLQRHDVPLSPHSAREVELVFDNLGASGRGRHFDGDLGLVDGLGGLFAVQELPKVVVGREIAKCSGDAS